MGEIRIDPRKQFSKKLARWTAVFWFLFMTWLSVIFLLAPASALYCVYMGIIVTVVMIVNVWAYTQNSIYEKAAFAMLSKAKIEIGLKNVVSAMENGRVTNRPYFGMTAGTVTANYARQTGLSVEAGVLVSSIESGGAAEKAGMKAQLDMIRAAK